MILKYKHIILYELKPLKLYLQRVQTTNEII